MKFVRDGEAARSAQTASTSTGGDMIGNGADMPKEPLAELGITPGNVPAQGTNTSSGQPAPSH